MKLSDYKLKIIDGKYVCPVCSKQFKKLGMSSHFHKSHNPNYNNPGSTGVKRIAWNKGLDKTDARVLKNSLSVSSALKGRAGAKPTEEHKAKTSMSMKKAHAEGRAHNIGSSRWNNEPSYPEKFFMRVIENEFIDKNYIQEYSFGRFSLDFAWVHKKKCIEIDGEQHQRFKEYKERDERKDVMLAENGWRVLRISWKDMYSDTKHWIKVAKEFIN